MFMQDINRTASVHVIPAQRVHSGLVAGTMVETAQGWRTAETLRRGDHLHSFDGGLVRVVALDRRWLQPGGSTGLIHVPGGAFDCCSDVFLSEDQHLLIDTLADTDLPDASNVLIPATALVGHQGARRITPNEPVEVITPVFDAEEMLWANSGLLLHAPSVRQGAGRLPGADFTRLDLPQARTLLRRIMARMDGLAAVA